MPLLVLLRLGVRSLKLHKLRSSLSILGVVFGVAAVVAMSSVGEGARRETLAQIAGTLSSIEGSFGPQLAVNPADRDPARR